MKTKSWQLENSYTELPVMFYEFQSPEPVKSPKPILFNEALSRQLALDFLSENPKKIAEYLSGNKESKKSKTIAQAYAGHQFGHFNMLGDGRALLLGEQIDIQGNRLDIQLKGSGRTAFSRGGDGRATLYSMLREYLISEAMHGLGIPTTRSLAVVSTGEQVYRGPIHKGAVLTRVASSHIRVGTFEYARAFGSEEELKSLMDYTILRHYPQIRKGNNPELELLRSVMYKQIDLVVNWMRVGFIHGVMNTDNMSICGETIDYGPCAFMNTYHPKTVYSSIDANGRYAFGNQSNIAHWNLAMFANALLPMISEKEDKAVELAKEVLDDFQNRFTEQWYTMMSQKLGIKYENDKGKTLVDRLLKLMETQKADYTQLFLALERNQAIDMPIFEQNDFKIWMKNWKSKNPDTELMKTNNPRVIPINLWVENALESAVEGNMSPFQDLLAKLAKPYDDYPDGLLFEKTPADFEASYQTFCGT